MQKSTSSKKKPQKKEAEKTTHQINNTNIPKGDAHEHFLRGYA